MEKYSVVQAYIAMTEGKSSGKTELYMTVPEFSTEPQQDLKALSSQPGDERVVPRATQSDLNSSGEHKQLGAQ